jgi:NADP-dependent 3-hydroxy acid dehydrogenase YdfG
VDLLFKTLEANSKVAIVIGASSDIGYATSLALSKAGIRVAVGARRLGKLHEREVLPKKRIAEEDYNTTKEEQQPIAEQLA